MISRPWLWLPPEVSQAAAPFGLKAWAALRSLTTPLNSPEFEWKPLVWRGLKFRNPIGLAAGVDKDARDITAWWRFGVGFAEVGTIVPEPQRPNPGRIIDRDHRSGTVWNKMGFPSRGMQEFSRRLEKLPNPYPTPLLVNIGKNRETPLERASDDYCRLVRTLHGKCDGFVINISSPNTKGLRELLTERYIQDFLGPIVQTRDLLGSNRPLLLKVSPDLSENELRTVMETSLASGLDGWVLTNTTLFRPPGSPFPTEGGLSGKVLGDLSKRCLEGALKVLGPRRQGKLVISVGGVSTWKEIQERLEIGADLVEVYSALIFEGPGFFQKRLRELHALTQK